MKILITGGNGFLARNLKPLFEYAGYEVLAPSHAELDLLDKETMGEFFSKNEFEAIVHCAIKGGRRLKQDSFEGVYVPNIRMFEYLYLHNFQRNNVPVVVIGSGSEFDRRFPIQNVREETVFNRWPIDPYGLSKNIICRRALKDFDNMYVLRLFGCFNYDEDADRFIRSSIFNVKRGLPVRLTGNREYDFFYLDDAFRVIDYILQHGGPRHMNLVYKEKVDLMHIAGLIGKYTKNDAGVVVEEFLGGPNPQTLPYTGDWENLYSLPVAKTLLGLEEGIRRTCYKLT